MAKSNPQDSKRKDAAAWERDAGLELRGKHRMVMIREDYLSLCGGDACAAALLRTLQNWHFHKSQGAMEDGDVWIYMSVRQATEELLNEYSRNRIMAAFERLTDSGLVLKRHNPGNKRDRALQYQFAVSSVRNALTGLPAKSALRPDAHCPVEDNGNTDAALVHCPVEDNGNTDAALVHCPVEDNAKSQPGQSIVLAGTNNTTDDYTDVGLLAAAPTSVCSTVGTNPGGGADKLHENQQPGVERGVDAAPSPAASSGVDADAGNPVDADSDDLAISVQGNNDTSALASDLPDVSLAPAAPLYYVAEGGKIRDAQGGPAPAPAREMMQARWIDVVAAVARKSPKWGARLSQARVDNVRDGVISLHFADPAMLKAVSAYNGIAGLTRLINRVYGVEGFTFSCAPAVPPTPKVGLSDRQRATELTERVIKASTVPLPSAPPAVIQCLEALIANNIIGHRLYYNALAAQDGAREAAQGWLAVAQTIQANAQKAYKAYQDDPYGPIAPLPTGYIPPEIYVPPTLPTP